MVDIVTDHDRCTITDTLSKILVNILPTFHLSVPNTPTQILTGILAMLTSPVADRNQHLSTGALSVREMTHTFMKLKFTAELIRGTSVYPSLLSQTHG